ncbi:MAG: hypothetical protein HFJ30_00180 [Clostridia bacterium]|nr:hypothetical protein [Clostridia bacterium]
MRKLKIKKVYESKGIFGMLSILCDIRNSIFYQNKERIDSLIDTFRYNFNEIEFEDIFKDDDNRIYCIQTASNKFIEVDKKDLINFEF